MPPEPDKGEEKRDDWLKVEISVAEELTDAVTDFLTEMGSQGAFQESPEPQEADGLSAPPPQGLLKAGQVTKVLAEMGPGEYFGEMAALIQAPRTASARSLEASHIAVISADMLSGILRESDEVSLFMLKAFSKRIVRTNKALEELTQIWIKLTAILYFLRMWPLTEGRNPTADLMKATGKEAVEIEEVLAELDRQGILTFLNNRVTAFNRERALQVVDEQASF